MKIYAYIHFIDAIFAINRWNGQSFDKIISRIVFLWTRKTLGSEESARHGSSSCKRESPLAHQVYLVKHFKELTGRLMNSEYDSLAGTSESFNAFNYGDGHERVQSACWLIRKQNRRVCDDLGGECQSTPLSARDAFDASFRHAYSCVFTFFEIQLWKWNFIWNKFG